MSSHEELIARKMLRIQEIHRMDPARTALLVIDMQRSFTDSESSLYIIGFLVFYSCYSVVLMQ